MSVVMVPNVPPLHACGWGKLSLLQPVMHHSTTAAGSSSFSQTHGSATAYREPSMSSGRLDMLKDAIDHSDIRTAAHALVRGLAAGGGGMRLMPLAELTGYGQLTTLLRAVQEVRYCFDNQHT